VSLYLNALPLEVTGAESATVSSLDRDADRDVELSRSRDRGRVWQHYAYREKSYAWPLNGGALPAAFQADGEAVGVTDLPGAVVAFAGREAAVGKLQEVGFELRRNSIGTPARMSRRQVNLAHKVLADLPDGVGAFAALALQGLPLVDDGRIPGGVALVVDQWVEHRLPVALDTLAQAGIDVMGLRVRWQHRDGCGCPAGRVGDAGRVVGGDPSGEVSLLDAGIASDAPAGCLTPHANESMLVKYLASLSGTAEPFIAERLRAALGEFSEVGDRWARLETTAKNLGELVLFPGVTAMVQMPLDVPERTHLAMQLRPLALPAVANTTLNFAYGAPKLAPSAAKGLSQHGPYDEHQARVGAVNAVIVAPKAFVDDARRLRKVLTEGVQGFDGVAGRFHLDSFDADIETFEGLGPDAYKAAVLGASRSEPDIVFFVIQHADRYARRGQNPYYASKAALGSASMPSQAITIEKLRQSDGNLRWIADSLSLASYAKIGNVPYVLHDPDGGRELVLGIGRADIYDPNAGRRLQRFGASVAVRQDGDFLFSGSTTPVSEEDDYEEAMATLVRGAIDTYETEQGVSLDRLVVYVFRNTGRREFYAVRKAIGKRAIEFALIHVNRDSPLWLVQRDNGSVHAPARGTQVALSLGDRLVITGDPSKPGAAHPLRLRLDDHSTYRMMNRLVKQAFGFTQTSYRTFLPSNEPSPILFGRLLAEKLVELAPYGFDPATAAGPFGRNPWFV
jgi:hypothetical protein